VEYTNELREYYRRIFCSTSSLASESTSIHFAVAENYLKAVSGDREDGNFRHATISQFCSQERPDTTKNRGKLADADARRRKEDARPRLIIRKRRHRTRIPTRLVAHQYRYLAAHGSANCTKKWRVWSISPKSEYENIQQRRRCKRLTTKSAGLSAACG